MEPLPSGLIRRGHETSDMQEIVINSVGRSDSVERNDAWSVYIIVFDVALLATLSGC
jgi:hypothetical protein